MYLEVMPGGAKYWRLKYRFAGKEKRLALGVYPEVSLAEARSKREQARKQIAEGEDPSLVRRQKNHQQQLAAASTFEAMAREWHGFMQKRWTEQHAKQTLSSLELHIFPCIGSLPVSAITPQDMIAALKRLEGKQRLETLRRLYQRCSAIFGYARDTGRLKESPMPSTKWFDAPKVTNHARFADGEIQQFLRALDLANLQAQTRLALKLMAMTFLRSGEMRLAEWAHIDFEQALWFIPPENTKMGRPHLVPLSHQALDVLRAVEGLTGKWRYVFSGRDPQKPMSSGTMITAIYRMGYKGEATVHGFRGTASTILHEKGFRSDAIERQLAHSDKDKIRAAYNHAEHLEERRVMMQWWADYLEGAGEKSNIVPLKRTA